MEFDADNAQALIENLTDFVIQVMTPVYKDPSGCCVRVPVYDLFATSERRQTALLAARVSERFEEIITRP